MSKVSVVIVNFHCDDQTRKLEAVLRSVPSIQEIVVIDNSKINLGFSKAVNFGIRKILLTNSDSILLINPDVVLEKESFEIFLEESDYEISSPVIMFQRQGREVYDHGGKINLVSGRAEHVENDKPKEKTEKVDYVSGACMLINNKVFEKIGLLDERFFMYFEDVDFCFRAKKAGFSVGVNLNCVVEHQIVEHRFSHNTFKIRQQLKSNLLFITKWVPWYFLPIAAAYYLVLLVKLLLVVR